MKQLFMLLDTYFKSSTYRYMYPINWIAYQQDCEDALKLECSYEDLKVNNEVKKVAKQIKKQRRYINHIYRLYEKNGLW